MTRILLISMIISLQWTGSRFKLLIGMDITSQRCVLPFFHVDLVPQVNDLVHSLVVHVCATVTYLNKWVF